MTECYLNVADVLALHDNKACPVEPASIPLPLVTDYQGGLPGHFLSDLVSRSNLLQLPGDTGGGGASILPHG